MQNTCGAQSSQICNYIEDNYDGLNELESFVDVLEKKIGDILAWLPEDEEIRNKDALEESPRCELATTLFSMKSQTKRISRKISNIIDRVQL